MRKTMPSTARIAAPRATDRSDAPRRPRGAWRRYARRSLIVAAVFAIYPAFVLGTVYSATTQSDLPGGRHGPKDAYRHSLASAIVAYTGSPRLVEWATFAMEGDGHADAACAMDAHNNRIGARIGAEAESWDAMRTEILDAVGRGGVEVEDTNRITWLPPERWQERLY
ncbi:MAG: hypothetical protein KA144_00840 [Xanthomonadaceae bacterium]|nr:hypothetical protein [Xanthomonadaceae bacterium]